jgi:hypothetical protein
MLIGYLYKPYEHVLTHIFFIGSAYKLWSEQLYTHFLIIESPNIDYGHYWIHLIVVLSAYKFYEHKLSDTQVRVYGSA